MEADMADLAPPRSQRKRKRKHRRSKGGGGEASQTQTQTKAQSQREASSSQGVGVSPSLGLPDPEPEEPPAKSTKRTKKVKKPRRPPLPARAIIAKARALDPHSLHVLDYANCDAAEMAACAKCQKRRVAEAKLEAIRAGVLASHGVKSRVDALRRRDRTSGITPPEAGPVTHPAVAWQLSARRGARAGKVKGRPGPSRLGPDLPVREKTKEKERERIGRALDEARTEAKVRGEAMRRLMRQKTAGGDGSRERSVKAYESDVSPDPQVDGHSVKSAESSSAVDALLDDPEHADSPCHAPADGINVDEPPSDIEEDEPLNVYGNQQPLHEIEDDEPLNEIEPELINAVERARRDTDETVARDFDAVARARAARAKGKEGATDDNEGEQPNGAAQSGYAQPHAEIRPNGEQSSVETQPNGEIRPSGATQLNREMISTKEMNNLTLASRVASRRSKAELAAALTRYFFAREKVKADMRQRPLRSILKRPAEPQFTVGPRLAAGPHPASGPPGPHPASGPPGPHSASRPHPTAIPHSASAPRLAVGPRLAAPRHPAAGPEPSGQPPHARFRTYSWLPSQARILAPGLPTSSQPLPRPKKRVTWAATAEVRHIANPKTVHRSPHPYILQAVSDYVANFYAEQGVLEAPIPKETPSQSRKRRELEEGGVWDEDKEGGEEEKEKKERKKVDNQGEDSDEYEHADDDLESEEGEGEGEDGDGDGEEEEDKDGEGDEGGEGTKKTKKNSRAAQPARGPYIKRDMYQAFDGTALVFMGYLLEELVAERMAVHGWKPRNEVKLKLRKPQEVNPKRPQRVYWDNDEPEARSRSAVVAQHGAETNAQQPRVQGVPRRRVLFPDQQRAATAAEGSGAEAGGGSAVRRQAGAIPTIDLTQDNDEPPSRLPISPEPPQAPPRSALRQSPRSAQQQAPSLRRLLLESEARRRQAVASQQVAAVQQAAAAQQLAASRHVRAPQQAASAQVAAVRQSAPSQQVAASRQVTVSRQAVAPQQVAAVRQGAASQQVAASRQAAASQQAATPQRTPAPRSISQHSPSQRGAESIRRKVVNGGGPVARGYENVDEGPRRTSARR